MNKPRKEVPHYASEAEERTFWESHDSTDYVDWSKAQRAQPMGAARDPGRESSVGCAVYQCRDVAGGK